MNSPLRPTGNNHRWTPERRAVCKSWNPRDSGSVQGVRGMPGPSACCWTAASQWVNRSAFNTAEGEGPAAWRLDGRCRSVEDVAVGTLFCSCGKTRPTPQASSYQSDVCRFLDSQHSQVRPARRGVLLSARERSRRHPAAVPHQRGTYERSHDSGWFG